MISDRNYAYDLSMVEPLRKTKQEVARDFKIIKGNKKTNTKNQQKAKVAIKSNKVSLIITTLSIFSMLIILSFRYNLISEKNLQLQRLSIEESKANALFTTTEIQVDKTIDEEFIESFAKQQLGMQKPEKSQIVYIDSTNDTKIDIVKQNSFLKTLIDKIIK